MTKLFAVNSLLTFSLLVLFTTCIYNYNFITYLPTYLVGLKRNCKTSMSQNFLNWARAISFMSSKKEHFVI